MALTKYLAIRWSRGPLASANPGTLHAMHMVADVEADDRPSYGAEGALCYCKDTKKLWKWTSAAIWEDVGTSGGALGTVTSVGLALPGEFTVSGSPVTIAGSLSAAWVDQLANRFLAGPNGATGTPSFRAIVSADLPTHAHTKGDISSAGQWAAAEIPSLDASKIATGTLDTARLGSGTANTTTFLRGDQTWATPAGGASAWTTIKKVDDESITNDAALGADAVLKFTTLANTQYHVRLVVWYQTGASGDFKYRLTHGGTTTRVKRASVRAFSTLSANWPTALLTAFDAADIALAGTGTDGCITEDVWLQVGASGGLLAFEWAQNTANGTPTIVLEGSHLEYMVT